MLVKRSVTGSLAKALFGIVILSVLATGLALTTVAGSRATPKRSISPVRCACKATGWPSISTSRARSWSCTCSSTRQSLQAPALQKLARFYVPAEVRNHYLALQRAWQTMGARSAAGGRRAEVAGYVVDHFVSALRRYSEQTHPGGRRQRDRLRRHHRPGAVLHSLYAPPGGHAAAASGRRQPARAATSATRSWTWRCRTNSARAVKPSAPCRTSWPGSISRWS